MLVTEVFIAAIVNIANTLSWALLYIIRNPEVQEMLQEELDQVVGPTRLPDIEDKKNLPFLEATITACWEPSHFLHPPAASPS